MSIASVNIGAAANDGTGDPLRGAFNKLNLNDADLQSQITTVSGAASAAASAASAAQTTANNAVPASTKGQPNGVATLDSGGKIPATQFNLTATDVGADPTGTAAAAVTAFDATLDPVAHSGDYNDLSNKPVIPTVPTISPFMLTLLDDADATEARGTLEALDANAVSPFMLTLLDDADAPAARTTLGAAADSEAVKLTGNQTIAGNKTFSGKIIPGVFPCFRARASVDQSMTATAAKVTFDTEDFDTDNFFASSRFTPTVAGYYLITTTIRTKGTGTVAFSVYFYKSGALYTKTEGVDISSSSNPQTATGSDMVFLNGSGDYVEVWAAVVASSGAGLSAANASSTSFFSGHLVRAT